MLVKMLMSWDIKPGQERAYSEFVMQELVPSMAQMGLHLNEAWHTIAGEGPQILFVAVTEDLETTQRILENDGWQSLHEKLLKFVTNYSHKVIPAQNRFQI